jgi:peptidoglycan/LPS O-acetylase OafA/YrhL
MTAHLWSLCVEMQFYVGIALFVAVIGRRGLYLIPALCVAVTGLRIATGTEISIVT